MGVRGVLRTMGEGLVGFWCPGCEEVHLINTEVSDRPHAPAWDFNGNHEAPTFAPSIFVNKGRVNPTKHVCHSHVTDGKIIFLNDCTHALAGQTVQLVTPDKV